MATLTVLNPQPYFLVGTYVQFEGSGYEPLGPPAVLTVLTPDGRSLYTNQYTPDSSGNVIASVLVTSDMGGLIMTLSLIEQIRISAISASTSFVVAPSAFNPTIVVGASSYSVGDTVNWSSTGWAPLDPVNVTVVNTATGNISEGQVTADSTGALGSHSFKATGAMVGGNVLLLKDAWYEQAQSTNFEVFAIPPPTPKLILDKASYAVGNTVSWRIMNFPPSTQIQLVDVVGGTNISLGTVGTTDANGVLSGTFTAGANLLGANVLTAETTTGGYPAVANFIVTTTGGGGGGGGGGPGSNTKALIAVAGIAAGGGLVAYFVSKPRHRG